MIFPWLERRTTARRNLLQRISALEEAVFVQMNPDDWAAYQDDVAALVRSTRKLRKLVHSQGWFKEAAAEADHALKAFAHIPD